MMTYHTKRTFLFVLLTLLLTGSANAQTHEAEGRCICPQTAQENRR